MAILHQLSQASSFTTPGYDSDALLYITANTLLTEAQKGYWNTFVLTGKSSGWWSSIVAIYPFIGGTAASHAINAKSPGTYNITWNGTLTHSSYGVTGDEATGYGNTGILASTVLAQTGHIAEYVGTKARLGSRIDVGAYSTSESSYITFASLATSYVANGRWCGNEFGLNANAARGRYILNRQSSSSIYLMYNGVKGTVNTTSISSSAPGYNIYISALNNSGTASLFSSPQFRLVSIGGALTDSQCSSLDTAMQALQVSLGRSV